jgi:hypothetical protein
MIRMANANPGRACEIRRSDDGESARRLKAFAVARAILRAALPWIAAALMTTTSLEGQFARRAPSPLLIEDRAPPPPQKAPKYDPDFDHSIAIYVT